MKSLIQNKTYLAHTNNKNKETLLEHTLHTEKILNNFLRKKNVDSIFKKTIKASLKNNDTHLEPLIYSWLIKSIVFHDIGKINPRFQKERMRNNIDINYDYFQGNSEHSVYSSVIYLDYFMEEHKDLYNNNKKEFTKIFIYIVGFSFLISNHHSPLGNYKDYKNKLNKCIKYMKFYKLKNTKVLDIILEFDNYVERLNIDEINFYILNKLLFSIIVESDFIATSEYMTNSCFTFNEINERRKFIDKYKDYKLYQKKVEYIDKNHQYLCEENRCIEEIVEINDLRTEMCIEAEKTLAKNYDKNIFYLEQPAGAGKTNTSISLAMNIIENCPDIKNIRYIFPRNTLSDQTYDILKNIWDEETVTVVNSSTLIKEYDFNGNLLKNNADNDENIDYQLSLLQKQFLNYPFYITSHIKLFDILFGTSKQSCLMLSSLFNSVVIIDEIQLYSNSIWKHFMTLVESFAINLNIKFIIMSATLPKINTILNTKVEYVDLIPDAKKYFQHRVFKDRVKIDISLLDNEKIFNMDILINEIVKFKKKKVLVACLSKKTAKELHRRLKQLGLKGLYLLTGDDNDSERRTIIRRTRKKKPMLLISTQLIEVGVDIDMDVGFQNLTTIEGLEQFCARINRSNLNGKPATVFIFELDRVENIYKDDIRTNTTIKNPIIRKAFEEKDFKTIYDKILSDTNKQSEKNNKNNYDDFVKKCGSLKFKDVEDALELIKPQYQIYLCHELEYIEYEDDKDEKECKLVTLNGREIWEEYCLLLENRTMKYAEKQILLNKLRVKMNYFTYSVYEKQAQKCKFEFINGYFLIEDGESFINDGKFNREKLSEDFDDIFI